MACQRTAWPALPRHLLGSVLSRLRSLADRVRLRAVCRPWRIKLLALPTPPQLPWLALPLAGTVYDVASNKTYRLQIPNQDSAGRDNMVFLHHNDGPCYSAGGNMFFFLHQDADDDDDDGRCSCSLVDALSGAATPLPELAALLQPHMVNTTNKMKIEKATISSRPDRLLAVLARDGNKSRVFISTCRSPAAGEITNTCAVMREMPRIVDIAFFQGKLYAHLAMYYELVAADLSNFEADLGHGPRLGRWIKKARGLDGGWALFVGKPCSRAVRASGVRRGARGNCIYFVGDYGNPFQHSGVYSMADEVARPLLKSSVSRKFKRTRDNYQRWRFPAWFFPVEV
ncbi:uncharacterized protein LOC106866790 [Brachypodium distachyon]|uniref:KIB1-4 beta-propeller domain-containing protein n=1 Tax=Brachypodium distachyon TaxID=15368 RepID=A0A2K2CKK8_BRADI|nr:uncharacterized protein LOC106866790 [Brachypodium distachyon]PNT62564.1 hypothetical protein BRADI_4g05115v3 [Brachypodium distachyon]|eukprot:XP_014758082.1 uncharacterized protein LOC106866790 [Brachypodium distachyon]